MTWQTIILRSILIVWALAITWAAISGICFALAERKKNFRRDLSHNWKKVRKKRHE